MTIFAEPTSFGAERADAPIDFLWESRIVLLTHRNSMEDMPDNSIDILRGTLDLLILKALSWGPAHGYGVARWIEQATNDVLQIEEGSLYPALHRLVAREWIDAEWGTSENNRRAKFYTLTAKGRAQLRVETATFTRFAHAVFAALEAPPSPA